MNFSMKKIVLVIFFACSMHATTYEEIRQQVEQEANEAIQHQQDKFNADYVFSVCKISFTTLIASALVPLAFHATSTNKLKMASMYSGLAGLFGYLSFLQHAELMENRRITNETVFEADRVYHKKLGHVHTRHYLQDIAKYLMDRLQKIVYTMPEEEMEKRITAS